MHRNLRIIAIFALSAVLLSSCNSKPDHRKYIPKDASLVAGINLSSLSKKIAWNMITGSKLFKEMQSRMPEKSGSDVMSGIDKAGIDVLNTFYVFAQPDNRYGGQTRATALIPLADAAAWEAYVKKSFPTAQVQEHNKLKIASLDGAIYMGWDKHLLVVMNALSDASQDMTGELDNVFNLDDKNSIKSDAQFEKLQAGGHDLSLWVNYSQIMDSYNDRMVPQMSGVSVSKSMWKGTSFACGFDFVKGKITGDMAYYASKSMDDIYKEFGARNVDNDMMSRLPGQNLDLMMATHFSTKALRTMMDSTGLLGLANSTLSDQNTNVDNILEAFTGDMAFAINDLNVTSNTNPMPGESPVDYNNFCMSYIMKINKKENFDQLMKFAQGAGLLPITEGYVLPISIHDSVFVMYNNQFAVFSNKSNNAAAMLHGNTPQHIADAVASEAKKHPFSLFIDVQETMSKVDLSKVLALQDMSVFNESKKLLSSVSVNGGEYANGAMQTHLEVNFTNKDENSIITLLDYGMRVSDAMRNSYEAQPPVPESGPPAAGGAEKKKEQN